MPSLAVSTDRPDQVTADVLVLAVARPSSRAATPAARRRTRPACARRSRRRCCAPSGVTGRPDAVHRVPVRRARAAPVVALAGVGDAATGDPTPRRCAARPVPPPASSRRRRAGRLRAARRRRGGRRGRRGGRAARRLRLQPRTGCASAAGRRRRSTSAVRRWRPRGRRPRRRGGAAGPACSPTAVAARPRPREHPAVRPLPRRASPTGRRRRRAACRSRSTVLDEKQLRDGGLRRHPRRRPGLGPARRGWSGSTTPPQGAARPRRARRQGHHLRLRRPVDQARRRHGGHEDRHGRRRRGARDASSRPPGSACRSRVSGWLALAENMPSGTAQRPVRRPDHPRRQDRRGAQHRRRGPAGPGRRDRRAPCEDEPGPASSTSRRSPAPRWSRSGRACPR